MLGSSRGLVVRELSSDSRVVGSIGYGSLLKLRQFNLPRFASVYSDAN